MAASKSFLSVTRSSVIHTPKEYSRIFVAGGSVFLFARQMEMVAKKNVYLGKASL